MTSVKTTKSMEASMNTKSEQVAAHIPEAKSLRKRNTPKLGSDGEAESKYFKGDKYPNKSLAVGSRSQKRKPEHTNYDEELGPTKEPISTKAMSAVIDQDISLLKPSQPDTTKPSKKLTYEFYNDNGVNLARALLGQKLMRKLDSGEIISGIIVETEAYMGVEDKAAHSYKGRRTGKTEAMFMPPGTAYVYHIYGMYCCMNISSQGDGCAVLLRALDPYDGLEKIRQNRVQTDRKTKDVQLCNGPSKLCMGLNITKASINKQDMCNSDAIWLEQGVDINDEDVITTTRINIDYAENWKTKPFRFYILGNKAVSVKDKKAEQELQ